MESKSVPFVHLPSTCDREERTFYLYTTKVLTKKFFSEQGLIFLSRLHNMFHVRGSPLNLDLIRHHPLIIASMDGRIGGQVVGLVR